MQKKKGISLIVLVITIIVIIILASAVILSLANNNPIAQANEATYKSSIDAYKSELNMTLSNIYVTDFAFKPSTLYAAPWDGSATTAGTVKQYISSMTAEDGKDYIIQQGKLIYTGTDTGKSTWTKNIGIQDSKSSDYITSKGVNKPVLLTGMTPVKWNGSAWVNTTEADSTWYNYVAQGAGVDGTSQWANAITADGSMWVWIPRYVYKISSGWHSTTTGVIDIQFSKGTNDYWNTSVIGALNLVTGASASNGTWTNHPAFSFGNVELTGIWVAKFEASNNSGKAKIVPNVASWRTITPNDIFTACRTMEIDNTYGWGTSGVGLDTHMMKNIEWGAVAYLTHSKYGRNGNQVWVNPDSSFLTGRAGTAVDSAQTATTVSYETSNGVKASTTGNVYGLYDMSGGSWESTAAYVNNGHNNIKNFGANILNAAEQYKDVYTVTTDSEANNYSNTSSKKGDAIYEISGTTGTVNGWNSDLSQTPSGMSPFFGRGGNYYRAVDAGIFNFAYDDGDTSNSGVSFRPVLTVSSEL